MVHGGHVLLRDVRGQGEVCDAGGGQRGLAGLDRERRELAGINDPLAEDRDVGEQRRLLDLLVRVRAETIGLGLARDRDHRRVVLRGVVQAVEEVDRAGTRGADHGREPAIQLGLRARGEGPSLLVPDVHERQPV